MSAVVLPSVDHCRKCLNRALIQFPGQEKLREITPILTPELERHTKTAGVVHTAPYPVQKYSELVQHIARLAYLNKDHLLFYRGQTAHYVNKAGGATFYPTICRGDALSREEVGNRFWTLDRASRSLRELFIKAEIQGHQEITRKRLVQWSILQHYQVCQTPLIDFTQSVRVACSFAQATDGARVGYTYVFGLPYMTNRISSNSEHDLVLVRLLSICPPAALRPYFQEGYLAGTADITTEYEEKNELDFNRRLIAQFEIPIQSTFWGRGVSRISDEELFPNQDSIRNLCASIDVSAAELEPEALGTFMAAWTALEQLLVTRTQWHQEGVLNLGQALRALQRRRGLPQSILDEIEKLRKLRNRAVHGTERPSAETLRLATDRVDQIRSRVQEEPLFKSPM